jgi:O-antigen/teichoic acid export membrane protein
MFHYGTRAQVGSFLQLANGRLDVIILQFFRPLSQVGYYVVAQTIAELVIQLADAFQWSNMALVSRDEGAGVEAGTSSLAVRHHALVSGVAALANVAFGSIVILFAYGPAFHRALVPMILLLPGVWLLGIGMVVQGDLGGRGRPGLASTLVGISAVVTVVLDLALIPPFGVIGAAIASVCAYATFGIGSLIALGRVSGIPIRRLAVPTRSDLAAYAAVARRVASRRRPRSGS